MISSPLLVHEKIWLDKPKYDAAERRYYEKLAKSSESAKVANSTDTIVTNLQDNESLMEEQDVQASLNDPCSMSDKMSPSKIDSEKSNVRESTLIKNAKIEVSSANHDQDKMNEDKKNYNTKHDNLKYNNVESVCSPSVFKTPGNGDFSEKHAGVLPDSSLQSLSESEAPQSIANSSKSFLINKASDNKSNCLTQTNKADVGSKSDKHKKSDVHSRDNTATKGEIVASLKIETGDVTSSKVKGQNKAKVADDKGLKQEFVPDKGSIDPVSDVVKLKGYFLPSKNLSFPSESVKNKGTNVNTIPEISKITTCYEKSKNSQNNSKKVPLTRFPLPDKQESVELIIPSDGINDPQAEDQAKKESKKKKRHKKERQRDKKGVSQNSNSWNSLAGEVAKARQHIKNSLQCIDDIAVTSNTVSVEVTNRLNSLEKENLDLKNQVSELVELLKKMDLRISSLEKTNAGGSKPSEHKVPAPAPHPKKDDAEDDDGVDLFGSDSEDEDTEAARIKEQRLAEYAARKAKKPVLIAKSNIILDVKTWDDETNMKELEAEVRKITTDGLVWGASKLVPLAYGIHKLQISCVVEDDKVSVDWLQETIQEIEDYVQSVDIAAFNKV